MVYKRHRSCSAVWLAYLHLMESFLSLPCTQEVLLSLRGRLVNFKLIYVIMSHAKVVRFTHMSISLNSVAKQKDGWYCQEEHREKCNQFGNIWQDARSFHRNGQRTECESFDLFIFIVKKALISYGTLFKSLGTRKGFAFINYINSP